jgi:hypothetical protein
MGGASSVEYLCSVEGRVEPFWPDGGGSISDVSKIGAVEEGVKQVAASPAIVFLRAVEGDAAHIGIAEVGVSQVRRRNSRPSQSRPAKVGPPEVGPQDVSASETGHPKVGTPEDAVPQRIAAEIRSGPEHGCP